MCATATKTYALGSPSQSVPKDVKNVQIKFKNRSIAAAAAGQTSNVTTWQEAGGDCWEELGIT